MKIFNSIGHFFAWVLHTALPKATTAVEDIAAELTSPIADAIAGLLGKDGAAVQSGLEAIAGDVLKAFGDAGEAIGDAGLNVSFDKATAAAIEQIYTDLKSLFGKAPAAASATANTSASAGTSEEA